jgi:alpha-beta hydrolase superfamily lysophospholipase
LAITPPEPHYFESFDGIRLAWRELGEGRPVVLLHGYLSDSVTNWIRYGHAEAVAARGFRVVMLDLRAHGASDKPHDPAFYQPDALTRDAHAFVAHLGLSDYDLGGYSLGARTVSRMLATGATPGKVILSGMGLVEAFLKTSKGDPQALLRVIDTFVGTPLKTLKTFDWQIQVLCGVEDQDNGSAPALVEILPNAVLAEVPGGHMSAVIKPELGQAMAAFLAG